jgi:cytochrome c-L
MRPITKMLFAGVAFALIPVVALALEPFRHTITGDVLDLETAPKEGRDTEAVKKFLETGHNPYNEDATCLPAGEETFLVACSGCHGHLAEGKVGPGLNDDYWTYPKNMTDKGMFETIFGGAQGMMGPHNDLQLNEILLVMSWIRHLYTGPVETATWLTPEQAKKFKPYKALAHSGGSIDEALLAKAKAQCMPKVQ